MRLIAIGDIHGHQDTLLGLLTKIEPREGDEFVLLGDYIDRGPDSRGVVDAVLELAGRHRVHALMGNHEEMLLAAYGRGRPELKFWQRFGGREALASYGVLDPERFRESLPPHHLRFYGGLLDFYESENHIFVHAGYRPDLPPAEWPGGTLRWESFDPAAGRHRSGKTVVCGHSAGYRVRDHGHVVCIDTGCGVKPNGYLTAYEVNTGQTWAARQPASRRT